MTIFDNFWFSCPNLFLVLFCWTNDLHCSCQNLNCWTGCVAGSLSLPRCLHSFHPLVSHFKNSLHHCWEREEHLMVTLFVLFLQLTSPWGSNPRRFSERPFSPPSSFGENMNCPQKMLARKWHPILPFPSLPWRFSAKSSNLGSKLHANIIYCFIAMWN